MTKKASFEHKSKESQESTIKEEEDNGETCLHLPQVVKSTLLLAILENGMRLDVYDKNYFKRYLEHPICTAFLNSK
jgi:hypothetical protein